MALGVAVALGLAVAGVLSTDSGQVTLPSAVERIVPVAGSLITPQGDVGADLADDLTGLLIIDGDEVPLDQLTRVEPLGQVFFSPGPGQYLRAFEPGTHSVTVVYWERTKTQADASSFTWQFRVGS